MADNIKQYDVQEGIVDAWHHKTRISEVITVDRCFLNEWDIVPVTLYKNGQPTKYRVLEASDVPGLEIGTAYNSETFEPISNLNFLKLVQDCISGTDHKIVSDGSVRNRGRVFLSIELAGLEKFRAAGRHFSSYLNFGNGHDKSSVLWANTSNTCTVCDNTYTMNLFAVEAGRKSEADDISLRVRHTPGAVRRFPDIAQLIDKAVGVQAEFAMTLNSLADIKCDTTEATCLFAGFIGRDLPADAEKLSDLGTKRTNRLTELFLNGRGNNGANLADAFSAVTDFYTHESVRSGNKAQQFLSSEFESGLRNKRAFLDIVTDSDRRAAMVSTGANLLAA